MENTSRTLGTTVKIRRQGLVRLLYASCYLVVLKYFIFTLRLNIFSARVWIAVLFSDSEKNMQKNLLEKKERI